MKLATFVIVIHAAGIKRGKETDILEGLEAIGRGLLHAAESDVGLGDDPRDRYLDRPSVTCTLETEDEPKRSIR